MKTDNVNIQSENPIPTPDEVKGKHPLPENISECVVENRSSVRDILDHKDPRFMIITGPCSIHDRDSALEYAERLKGLTDKVADRIFLIMRVYFEKPRTTVGWKGLIYDPGLDGSDRIVDGLFLARGILLDVIEKGLPAATEFLDPIIPQYIADLITWAAIGARTTESQTHRQMASGLSMPVGFKNATDGSIEVAVNAVSSAASSHSFMGVTGDGRSAVFKTTGNRYCHLVLRGGDRGPNYGSEYIAFAREFMKKQKITSGIIVDCSHANSGKDPERQPDVMNDIIKQVNNDSSGIVGAMLESNLQTGKQSVSETGNAASGISITDACLGWDETESLILDVYKKLEKT